MATKKYEIGATSRRRDGMYKKVAAGKWEKVSEKGPGTARLSEEAERAYNRRPIGGWGAKTMPVGERPAAKSPVARAEARKAATAPKKPAVARSLVSETADREDTHEAHTKAAEVLTSTAATLRKAGHEVEARRYEERASEHAEKASNRRPIGGWGAKTMPVGVKIPPGFADKKPLVIRKDEERRRRLVGAINRHTT